MSHTPEHDKRSETFSEEVLRSYGYVESVMHTADDMSSRMWHGWALREAFLAGISHNKKQQETH